MNVVPNKSSFIFGNMDEVPVQFDLSSGKTFDFQGKRQINLLKTTGSKKRLTAALSILSDGTKLPLMVIFKTFSVILYSLRKKYRDQAIVIGNANGWMIESIMLDWIRKIWEFLKLNLIKKSIYFSIDLALARKNRCCRFKRY